MNTLGDLRERFLLYAVCTDCRRMERLAIDGLIGRLGADLTIADFRRRIRCRSCGQRTEDMRIVYVGEQGRLAGFRYRRDSGPVFGTQSVSSSVDSSVSPKPSTPT